MTSTSDGPGPAKEGLREAMRAERAALHPDERALRSARVVEAAVGTPEWAEADVVGFYVSVGDEVETRDALAAALGTKRVAAPRLEDDEGGPEEGGLVFAEVASLGDLEEGPLGIPEPAGPALDPGALDVVLVPGLAFDPDGNRLGRGGGHYDRFLPTTDAWACGLAFRFQVVDRVPSEAHDAPVDAVATEDGLHRARGDR